MCSEKKGWLDILHFFDFIIEHFPKIVVTWLQWSRVMFIIKLYVTIDVMKRFVKPVIKIERWENQPLIIKHVEWYQRSNLPRFRYRLYKFIIFQMVESEDISKA